MTYKIELRQVERKVDVYRCDRLGCGAEAVGDQAIGWMCCALMEKIQDPMSGRTYLGSLSADKAQYVCPACTQILVAAMNAPAIPAAPKPAAKFVVAMDDKTGKSVVAEVPAGKTSGEVAMVALIASLEAHLQAEGGLFTIKDFELVEAGGGWLNVVALSDAAGEALERWQRKGESRA